MVFSSILFIFRFLPIAMGIYFLTPKKLKNLSLLILSLIFYSWGEPRYFLLMIASIFVDYFISINIEKNNKNKKIKILLLAISIIFNVGILFFFKYINFFIENINSIFNMSLNNVKITLPLGISFYTFQTMSYTIDVFLGKVKAEKNIINFGAFVCLFPQLIAGPIVKYIDISKELKNRDINLDEIQEGIRLFILGLGSKILIANNIGSLWNEVETMGFNNISTILAWMGIIAFSLQIYFDFNGYSTMAIGMGKMMGFYFPKNFNYPYISTSVTDFWRRWHITLSTWFRDYVYIPLGGNRVKKYRWLINIMIVWTLTGLWHGASWNFVIWGMYFGILLILEKLFIGKFIDKLPKFFRHIYALFFILIGWLIFFCDDLTLLYNYIPKIFNNPTIIDNEFIFYIKNYMIFLISGILFSIPIVNKIKKTKITKTIVIIAYVFLFVVCICQLCSDSYNPFLYFRF